ncbi:MAG: hypothetical protein ABFS21_08910 [Actinomycetota bacterium]
MTDRNDLLRRVMNTNPVPGGSELPASLADSRPPVALIIGSEVPSGVRPAPRNVLPWRGLVVAAAAAVLVVLAIAVPLLLSARQSPDPASVTSTLPLSTTTAPPPTTVAPAAFETWQRVGADAMEPVVGLFDITRFGTGFVAMGFDPGEDHRQDGVIFMSDDGLTWTRVAEEDPALTTGTALMYGITEGGPGLVAGGMSCEDSEFPCLAGPYPTIWTSVDGSAWTRTQIEQGSDYGAVSDVLATDHGIVAVGNIEGPTPDGHSLSRPAVWQSQNGVEWSRVWQGVAVIDVDFMDGPSVNALAQAESGRYIGVGSAFDEGGESVAAVWFSDNAVDWERIDPESPAFKSEHGNDAIMLDAVPSRHDGFIAVGSDAGVQAAVWVSSDGHFWTRVDLSGHSLASATSLSTILPVDRGFVAAGPHGYVDQAERPVTLWTSPDGVSWSRVEVLGSGNAQSIVTTDSGIAVAGATPSDYNFHASAWTGPAFDPANPPPDPTPGAEQAEAPVVSDIGRRGAGLTCERLLAEGYSYPQAASYWLRYEMPDGYDLDADGPPCASAYPPGQIAAVFGESDALSVRLVEKHATGTFTATGPAVDAGIVCAEGTIDYTNDPEPSTPGVLWRWEDIFTCGDGTGTFILGVDEYIESGGAMYGVWNIVSGTGDYANANGGGATDSVFEDYDASTGRLWLEAGEN